MYRIAMSAVVATVFSTTGQAKDTKYNFVTGESTVTWFGEKEVGGSHKGEVDLKSGYIVLDGQTIKDAKVVIDMTTIKSTETDEELSKENKKRLTGHLSNEDFFHVGEFGEATFKMNTKMPIAIKGSKVAIPGMLTIRNETNPHTLMLENVKMQGNKAMAIGTTTFDRSKFDVKYNSKSFPNLFKVAADKIIKNEIQIGYKIVAKK